MCHTCASNMLPILFSTPESVGCWLEAAYPTEGRRDADAASDVRPDAQDGASPSDEGALPT